MRQLNLFIVGAARSGTTALWHWLKENPGVYMPGELSLKEPAFFSPLKKTRFNKFEDYMKIFEGANENHRWIGEASTAYLTDRESAGRIYRYNPNAKIIIILRNPAQRAYSLYNWMVQEGYEYAETFEEALKLEKIRINKETPNYFEPEYYHNYLYFNSGLYYEQVKRYIDLFKKNVLLIKFEDFIKDSNSEIHNVCRFLDVRPTNDNTDYFNESKRVYSSIIQFVLRKITKFYFSEKMVVEKKNILKKTIFEQVQKELNTLSLEKNVSLFTKLRIYHLFNNIIKQLHLKALVLSKNTKYERDSLIRMGHKDKKPKKMNNDTFKYLKNKYRPDVLTLSAFIGVEFPEWDV
jgi:hypothetical protein